MDFNRLLQGKKAVVTAGAHGMGFSIARLFVQHGATVAVTGRRDEGEKSAEYLRKFAPDSFFMKTDMGDMAQVEAFCDEVLKRFGHVDVIVNNVGINDTEPSYTITEEKYERILRTNIKSVVTINNKLIPSMIERGLGGSIVHISTIHSVASVPWMGSYAVSKGGMNAFSRVMSTELGRFNIRTNVVCPGGVITGLMIQRRTENTSDMHGQMEHWQGGEPTYGPGHSMDIANACLFFASDMSAFTTGSTLMVDGGASNQLHSVERDELPRPDDYMEILDSYVDVFLSDDQMMEIDLFNK